MYKIKSIIFSSMIYFCYRKYMLKSKYLFIISIINQIRKMQQIRRCDCPRQGYFTYFCIQTSCALSRILCAHCKRVGHQEHHMLELDNMDSFSVYNPKINNKKKQYIYTQLYSTIRTVSSRRQKIRQTLKNRLTCVGQKKIQNTKITRKNNLLKDINSVIENINNTFQQILYPLNLFTKIMNDGSSLQVQKRYLVCSVWTTKQELSNIANEIDILQRYNFKDIQQIRIMKEAILQGTSQVHQKLQQSWGNIENLQLDMQKIENSINILKSLSPFSQNFQDSPYMLKARQNYLQKQIIRIPILQVLRQKKITTSDLEEEIKEIFMFKQANYDIFRKKMETLIKKLILKQSKLQIEEQQKQRDLKRKQMSEVQSEISKYINNIEKNIKKSKATLNEDQRKKFEKKKKQFQQKKIQIQNKYQVTFQPKQIQNQRIFSAEQLDMKALKNVIKNKYKEIGHSFLTLKLLEVKALKKGGQQRFKFTSQLNIPAILQFINDIAKKFQEISTQNRSICSSGFVQNISIYKKKMELYSQKFSKCTENKKALQNKLLSFGNKIDVVIVMDTTQSMKPYLEKAKTDSKEIIKKFKMVYTDSQINYAFVSYKDHCDKKVVETYDFDTAKNIEKKIENIIAAGGGDWAQAVHDGLYAVHKLNWRQNSTKFVFLIFDAPPHGRQYYQGPFKDDNYPNGCPCKITLKMIADFYNQNTIHLNIKQCGPDISKTDTSFIFSSAIRKDLYNISDLQSSAFSERLAKDLENRVQELESTLEQIKKYFKNIIKEILDNVQKDISNIIKDKQQLEIISKWEYQIISFKDFFSQYHRLLNLKIQDADQKKEEISVFYNNKESILSSPSQIKQNKESKSSQIKSIIEKKQESKIQVQSMIKDNNIEGLSERYKQQIQADFKEGDSKQKIVKTLIRYEKLPKNLAEQIVQQVLRKHSSLISYTFQNLVETYKDSVLEDFKDGDNQTSIIRRIKNTVGIQVDLAKRIVEKILEGAQR